MIINNYWSDYCLQ